MQATAPVSGLSLDPEQSWRQGHPPPALSRIRSLRSGSRVDDAGLTRESLDHLDVGPARPQAVHEALEGAIEKLGMYAIARVPHARTASVGRQ